MTTVAPATAAEATTGIAVAPVVVVPQALVDRLAAAAASASRILVPEPPAAAAGPVAPEVAPQAVQSALLSIASVVDAQATLALVAAQLDRNVVMRAGEADLAGIRKALEGILAQATAIAGDVHSIAASQAKIAGALPAGQVK